MDLVEHHNPIGQTPETHEVMLDVERGEQRLIDGPDAIGREQWTLALGEPARTGDGLGWRGIDSAQSLDALVQSGRAMDQLDIQLHTGRELAQKRQGTIEHGIAGRLSRQGQIETPMPMAGLQSEMGE